MTVSKETLEKIVAEIVRLAHPDRVILFVDGEEMLALNEAYGAAQVGLYAAGMSARYNGIMTYRTEPKETVVLAKTDVGAVGCFLHRGRRG